MRIAEARVVARSAASPATKRGARPELVEAEGVRAEVASTPVGQGEHVRCRAELLDDLERGRLLSLEPVRVQRVDEDVSASGGELPRGRERLVEGSSYFEHARAERARLRELGRRDRALGLEHDGSEAGASRVGGRRRGGVPRRRADDGARTSFRRLRDRDRHPAVLEAPGRVRSLALEVHLRAQPLRDPRRVQERRRPLAERDDRCRRAHGQPLAVAVDQRVHAAF